MGVKVRATNVPGIVAIVVIMLLIGFFTAVSYWTDGNIEWLILTFADRAVDVPFWLSLVLTFLLNAVAIIFNIIVEILKYVM